MNLEEWPTFYEDMQEDLEKYCSKFGEVLFVGAEKKLGSGVARRVNDHDMAGYICVYINMICTYIRTYMIYTYYIYTYIHTVFISHRLYIYTN